ncbi:ATP-binding cassette domain-containing protein [Rhizobium multihospitium]|uniref:Ribose transport system ATP-binding protein n=1 Tax=Rhizobium multihospitium TaxID=410764 RepID=A0A1C3X5E9_9HYPH|nr:ATP-binding cassette domain-containing protein [Rhizobium multihospitium]SCB47447.1 ribose transport system ATP-binding protein [Rhizobium multihospitium]
MSKHNSLLLEMSGVCKVFPGVRALHEITFDVQAGEVHGLVGENGAGKSTLMSVASGALSAEAGVVKIAGEEVRGNPQLARDLGLAIVRQEPSLMPDLTVAENLYLGLPESKRPPLSSLVRWARQLLSRWSSDVTIDVRDHVATLNPEHRFIVEIVKALACEPKVLVLDEPTEHLAAEDVSRLFARIREVTTRGASVIYISHRIREVQAIADRLTVLRDGEGQGTYNAATLSEDKIVSLIVGTSLDRTFPEKAGSGVGEVILDIQNFSGPGFSHVTLNVRRGEILGLAGIDANGQREFMRALAGLTKGHGDVSLSGKEVSIATSKDAMNAGVSYLPGDRHREGIFAELSVRENFSARSPAADIIGGVVNLGSEESRARQAVHRFAVKTPSIETPIRSLSGGNQQKVVLASVLASNPSVLLVDEPTQGVDVGARAEIYKILRDTAAKGVAIIVVSSDAQEVAGLSDRVAIFSRGQIVKTLTGDNVSEDNITSAVLKSTTQRDKVHRQANAFWKWAAGDAAPLVMVAAAILILGTAAAFWNPFYISPRSLSGMMTLVATLALVAYGQQLLMLVGGIDLSVGPLMGLSQVVASFFLIKGMPIEMQLAGWVLVIAVAALVGVINWVLVEPLKLHPMIATLSTFMAVQAVALLLRPVPGGMIDGAILSTLSTRLGFVPITFLAAVALALLLEFCLYRFAVGVSIRGLGSRPEAARVAGVSPQKMRFLAYVGCSVLAGIAAITMMQQVGIGDPRSGLGYTLSSIAAVVIGGASLFGGRGSFIGALLGAIFITQINAVTSFLSLDQAWQSYLLGGLILAAVALFSKSRQKVIAA